MPLLRRNFSLLSFLIRFSLIDLRCKKRGVIFFIGDNAFSLNSIGIIFQLNLFFNGNYESVTARSGYRFVGKLLSGFNSLRKLRLLNLQGELSTIFRFQQTRSFSRHNRKLKESLSVAQRRILSTIHYCIIKYVRCNCLRTK